MTADAKVGLLLGLIFIVVIAFLINGLPKFLQTAATEETFETQIEIPTAPDMVIDNRVVQTARELQTDVPLRQTTPPDQVVVLGESSAAAGSGRRISPEQIAPVSVQVPNLPVESAPAVPTPAQSRYHVVTRGEILPVIARKYYGPEEGNRRIVIQKLYEVNRDVLESPDKICVGDKLVIPPYEELLNGPRDQAVAVVPQDQQRTLLSRFADFFEPADEAAPRSARVHVVQEGETLWSIAEKTLGDGRRYEDILKLNQTIQDPDDVRAGMNLKIPQ